MQKIIDNPPAQNHTQTYGQYCLGILTDEYREWVLDSNEDWKRNRIRGLEGNDSFEADVVTMAILEVMDPS